MRRIFLQKPSFCLFNNNKSLSSRVVGGESFGLYGIDSPEKKQLCINKWGKNYSCGTKSTEYLKKLIGRRKLSCINRGIGKYGRFLFECTNGQGVNINEQMVKDGWAVAEYSKDYIENEKTAKIEKVGMWKGEFKRPKDWRKNN